MGSIRQINRVVLTGNLTRDPDLRTSGEETSGCALRVASEGRRRNADPGDWEVKPNSFDVVVYGPQAERCAEYLAKGRGVAVDGRLDWCEWQGEGRRREAVRIVAESVRFLAGPQHGRAPRAGADEASTGELKPVGAGEGEDGIAF